MKNSRRDEYIYIYFKTNAAMNKSNFHLIQDSSV